VSRQFRQRCLVAVHAEHTVGGHQAFALAAGGELVREAAGIEMP
jgi:hypothetical protein